MIFMRFVPALLLLTVVSRDQAFVWVPRFRHAHFRPKWGFQYSKGEPRMLYLPKNHSPKPASFRLHGYPVDTLNRTWNLIEGEKNGLKILILDSTLSMGGRNGRYSTFIAVRTDTNPFSNEAPEEKIVNSNGWIALYRLRFWQIPWTLSIRRIEEHLETLKSQNTTAGSAI